MSSRNLCLPTVCMTMLALGTVGESRLAIAQQVRGSTHRSEQRSAVPEPERGPMGYQRLEQPEGAAVRPHHLDRPSYNHNFTADRGFHIGPYHAPPGYRYRRWSYGDIIPRVYWSQSYWLQDYWLFGLDVPPVGFEWVRFGPDALLIDLSTGEVIQVLYGRFL